jgi:ferredoxin
VVSQAEITPELAEQARRGASNCPEGAIEIDPA